MRIVCGALVRSRGRGVTVNGTGLTRMMLVCAGTLTELRAGDNWLLLSADAGETALQAKISFYPMYAGIFPEVISNAT